MPAKRRRLSLQVEVTGPQVTIISLPNELLFWIFEDLDDEALYNLGILCRHLNLIALPILLERYSRSLLCYKGYVILNLHTKPIIYSALHVTIPGALPPIQSLSIVLYAQPLVQLETLSDVLQTQTSLDSLAIVLSPLHFPLEIGSEERKTNCETLTVALRKLLTITVEMGSSGRLRLDIRGTWGAEYSFLVGGNQRRFTFKDAPTSSSSRRGRTSVRSTAKKTGTQGVVTERPSRSSLCSLNLQSPLFFEDSWRNWTLHLCNKSLLSHLTIDASMLPLDFKRIPSWDDLLPKVKFDRLWDCTIRGTIDPQKLAVFLKNHSSTLQNLTIDLCEAVFRLPGPNNSNSQNNGNTRILCNLPGFDFPQLLHLSLGVTSTHWFITNVLNASPRGGIRPFLPNLRQITLLSQFVEYERHLDEAFNALSQLVTQTVEARPNKEPGGRRMTRKDQFIIQNGNSWCSLSPQPFWFSRLVFSFAFQAEAEAWLKTRAAGLTGTGTSKGKGKSKKSRTPNPSSSSISALICVQTLVFQQGYLTDEILDSLPSFLGLFSGLKFLSVTGIMLTLAKTLGNRGYWEKVKDLCPTLEKCSFEDGIEMSMKELTDKDEEGKWKWTVKEVKQRYDEVQRANRARWGLS